MNRAEGDRIKALRRARGWTQDQLAQATGVSRSAVAQWETGRAGFNGKLRLIADALEVAPRQLTGGFRVDAAASGATTGGRSRDTGPISNAESTLLRHFRELDDDDQGVLLHVARKLAITLPS